MQITESQARALMVALNAKTTATTTVKSLTKKLNEMPRWAGQVEEPTDPDMLTLFRQLCRDVQDGNRVDITTDEETKYQEVKEVKTEKGKTKKAKVAKVANEELDASVAKPGKAKKVKEDKPKVDKPGKEAKAKTKPDAPSNKQKVHKLWSKSKDKSTAKAPDYFKAIDEQVKLTTIKGWLSAWKHGKNLPAGAQPVAVESA